MLGADAPGIARLGAFFQIETSSALWPMTVRASSVSGEGPLMSWMLSAMISPTML